VLAVRADAGEPVVEHDLRFQHVDFLRQRPARLEEALAQ